MRGEWSNLFTMMGTRLTPEALEDFTKMIPQQINDILDRGYEVFKNNPASVADNYTPTSTLMRETTKQFQKIAAEKGINLSEDVAKNMVDEVWNTSSLPKDILVTPRSKSGTVRIASVPDFFVKSVVDDITKKPTGKMMGGKNLSDLTGVGQEIIKKLLGKTKNPINTIVEGTIALSKQVRFNQYLDEMVKRSNEQKVLYDNWLAGGKVGAAPRVPFLVNSPGEARKYFGGQFKKDWDIIKSQEGADIKQSKLGIYEDPSATIKPVDEIEKIRLEELDLIEQITNPVAGKYALKDFAESLTKIEKSSTGLPATLYQNLVLYPKGTSQMAKTILAPFTHARNFISAAAFAAANGIVPFGKLDDVKAAWNALQVAGPGTRKSNEFYQELLELGVVNSNVQLNQVMDLLEDAKFGQVINRVGPDYNNFNKFMKGLSRIKRFAQDAYTAEDDFWKIFTYLGEKNRLYNSFRNAGLRDGQEFIDMKGVKRIFNEEYLKKTAADLVKNNVPNYAFVSEFVKGLRKLPVGNFVAFPAEIMRTGTNIVSTALDEIFYTTTINGRQVNPLRARGLQRLGGMAFTTAAMPLGTVAAAQAIYDVSKEELDAMRRYVPQWSKNSVLVPFKDEEGNLSYVDFSHLNAYDTLTRPIQTVINAVESGRQDKDGIMDDFILGLIESTKELGEPFISESIWTEALQDVAPILGRGGVAADGREIYNKDPAIDPIGSKIAKSVAHLVESQAPLNWRQLGRLGLAIRPIDSLGRYDPRGNEYELGNELLGIAGMRRVNVDPSKSLNYKITNYKDGVRAARNIFTRATLRGGVVSPEEVIDAYIDANRALYEINRRMYLDVDAAKILGMDSDQIRTQFDGRGEGRAFTYLDEGAFRPYMPSRDVLQLFSTRSEELGAPNPLDEAYDVMQRIREILESSSVTADLFPNIQNPFKTYELPTLGPAKTAGLPPMAAAATVNQTFANNARFGNINPVSGLTLSEEVYLDPLGKAYRRKQRQTTNQTKLT